MKATTTFRKYLAIAWAIAVVWVYFGSLVNFHQHQIWKKQLNPTFAAAFKREKAKTGATASWTANSTDTSVPPVMVAEVPVTDLSALEITLFPTSFLHAPGLDQAPPAFDPGSSSLRAPPAC
jgi:hypothetical protein